MVLEYELRVTCLCCSRANSNPKRMVSFIKECYLSTVRLSKLSNIQKRNLRWIIWVLVCCLGFFFPISAVILRYMFLDVLFIFKKSAYS